MIPKSRSVAAGLASVCVAAAVPAGATGTIHCSAIDGSDAFVEMNLGVAAVESPSWIRIGAGGSYWSSLEFDRGERPEPVPVAIAQSFIDGRGMAIDVADESVSDVVAMIRIARIAEGDETFQLGHLHLVGRSVHPLSCDGP